MLSLKKREIKGFIQLCMQFKCHAIINIPSHAARYPVCMTTDYADSSLWRRRVTLTASGDGKAWLRKLMYGLELTAVV